MMLSSSLLGACTDFLYSTAGTGEDMEHILAYIVFHVQVSHKNKHHYCHSEVYLCN